MVICLSRSRGDVKKQRKKRKERAHNLPDYQKEKYQLIDNNWTHRPRAYCQSHTGYLTDGLMNTHRCIKRGCMWLKTIQGDDWIYEADKQDISS